MGPRGRQAKLSTNLAWVQSSRKVSAIGRGHPFLEASLTPFSYVPVLALLSLSDPKPTEDSVCEQNTLGHSRKC